MYSTSWAGSPFPCWSSPPRVEEGQLCSAHWCWCSCLPLVCSASELWKSKLRGTCHLGNAICDNKKARIVPRHLQLATRMSTSSLISVHFICRS